MDFEIVLKKLIDLGRKNGGYVYEADVSKYTDIDSDTFKRLESQLSQNEIEIIDVVAYDEEDINLDDIEDIDVTTYDQLSTSIDTDDSLARYLNEIGTYPLLSKDEELEAVITISKGIEAKMKRQNIELSDQNTISLEDYQALLDLEREADIAKEKLICANLRLVVSIAKNYTQKGVQLLDLIQEGNMGLIKACDKFDYTRGNKFSTYASWWIRQYVTRSIYVQARTIRVPIHVYELSHKIQRSKNELTQKLHRDPSSEDLSKTLNMSIKKINQIENSTHEIVSLESTIGEEEDSSLIDFISDPQILNPYEYTKKLRLRSELDNALDKLSERERRIINLRYGLLDGRSRTLDEVGQMYNLSRERIRQIETIALKKIKKYSNYKNLEAFIDKS